MDARPQTKSILRSTYLRRAWISHTPPTLSPLPDSCAATQRSTYSGMGIECASRRTMISPLRLPNGLIQSRGNCPSRILHHAHRQIGMFLLERSNHIPRMVCGQAVRDHQFHLLARISLRENGIEQMTNGGFFVITGDNNRNKRWHGKMAIKTSEVCFTLPWAGSSFRRLPKFLYYIFIFSPAIGKHQTMFPLPACYGRLFYHHAPARSHAQSPIPVPRHVLRHPCGMSLPEKNGQRYVSAPRQESPRLYLKRKPEPLHLQPKRAGKSHHLSA